MRAAPTPLRATPARRAAVQRSDQGASQTVLKRAPINTGQDAKHLSTYLEWQQFIRRFAHTMGVVRFSAGITADTIGRVIPRVEELDLNGDWIESEDPQLKGIFTDYKNNEPLQSPAELVRAHAWHYSVAGEMVQSVRDTPNGISWGIHSLAACEWDKPERGMVMIKLVPDGKLGDETAFVVPREQATRFWIPDEEWAAYATSPMAASVDDLHRYRSLARYARRTADSQLAMNGLVWMPDDDWPGELADDSDVDDDSVASPSSTIESMYEQLTQLRLTDDQDVAAIAPHLVHWASQWGPPQSVDIGTPLDPNGIEHRHEALEDFARGTNLPASLVVGGGPGDANHWTEWLVDDKFFDSAIAPTCDRIFHMDLTSTFLVPRLRVANYDIRKYRMGYDPRPVIVKADQSDKAHTAWLAGLLGAVPALVAMGFDEDNLATPEDLDRLFSVLAAKKAASSPFAKVTIDEHGGQNITTEGGGGNRPAPTTGPPNAGQAPPPPAANGQAPPSPQRVASVLGRALLAYSEDQPRDSSGKFGSGDAAQGPPGSGTPDDPFRVSSAAEAQQLIHEGHFVEMPSDQVSILIDRLAAISQDARAKGEKAPLYDLCKISVPDTNLFCADNKGIPRVEMPQLVGTARPGTEADKLPKNEKGETDITSALIEQLGRDGFAIDPGATNCESLKATQNQLDGAKVAGMMKSMEAGTMSKPDPIFVSRDNYIVDGHHRWAAEVGTSFVSGATLNMETLKVDMPISQLIPYVNEFSTKLGMTQMAASMSAPA